MRKSPLAYNVLAVLLIFTLVFGSTAIVVAQDEGETITIGATVPTLDAQFWNRYVEFMQEGAEAFGIELIVINADNNADAMARAIEDLVARGVDGIIHVPYWATGTKALMDTQAAGIPIIMSDVYVPDVNPQDPEFPNYIAFVGPSDEEAGYAMAIALFEAMEPDENGEKVVGVVDGTPGTTVAIDRRAGFDRALAEHPEVRLAGAVNGNFVRDESQEAFAALYQGNPDIRGVWAANGGTATGVIAALRNAGVTPGEDVLVVGMDLNPENIDFIESGELLFDIGGHWLQGGFALVMMYDYLNGFEIPPEQANVKLDLLPVTAATVQQFRQDYPEGVPAYDWYEHSRTYNPDAPPATFELQYSTEVAGEEAMAAPEPVVPVPEEGYTIGATVPTLDAQFWNRYVEFMQEGAEAFGIELIVINADNNADAMARAIEDLVARGVDGIIHVPYWATGTKALMDTQAAGIPIIMSDVYVPDVNPQDPEFPNYIAFVGPSDEEAGYAMAIALFEAMEPDENGEKVVGVVDGTPGTTVAIDRRAGFDRALAEHPEVRLAGAVNGNFVRDESQEAFAALYQGNPDIRGVWAANGGTATGVIAALRNAGVTPGEDVLVVGMDLNPENIDFIESGELLFDIGGHWLQGGFALVMMYDYLNGFEIPPEQANVKLDLLPVTAATVQQFRQDYPEGVPAYDWYEHSRTYNPDAPPATFELQYSTTE